MNKFLLCVVLLATPVVVTQTGCSTTPQVATYQTLAATSQSLKLATEGWLAYVQSAKDNHTVSHDTLLKQALAVQDATEKATKSLQLAITLAETTQSPTPAAVSESVLAVLNLITQFSKK